jgi:putative membrane protein (TIGR04086 family)
MRAVLFAVLCSGIPASLLGMLTAAALLTAFDLPPAFHLPAAAVPLLIGCFLSGFRSGRMLRSGGLHCGFLAALLLSALWYAAACLTAHRLYPPVLLLLSLPSGMCGGVCGVNTRLPAPRRRSHTAKRLPQRLVLSYNTRTGIRRAKKHHTAPTP